MLRRSGFLWLAFTLLLGNCAGIGTTAKSPYDGLTRTSYGPPRPVQPQSCSHDDPGTSEMARQLTAVIATPFAGISKVDPTVEREDLADKFRIPGDPLTPPVTILSRNNDGIVFWHDLELVPMSEVSAAASTFCDRRGKQAVWEGSAEQCGQPTKIPLAINGQQPVSIPTQVISSYLCRSESIRPRHRR